MIFLILSVYIILIFLYSLYLYRTALPYYKPLFYQPDPNKPPIDLHKEYNEFQLQDSLTFHRLFFGILIILPYRFFFSFWIAILMNLHLRYYLLIFKAPEYDKEERKVMAWIISFWAKFFILVNGVTVNKKHLPYEEVYKKYLGSDYDLKNQDNFSLIICNHIGFFEVVVNMIKYSAGFIAAEQVKNYWFIGNIAKAMNCLFLTREKSSDRQEIFRRLEERQKNFYEKKLLSPLVLFPEGTTTSGRHILKFKKGAFYALLPIKPEIFNIYQEDEFHLSIGASSVVTNYMRLYSYFRHRVYFVDDLPVIKPTDYMWKNWSHLGKEKWEIYAEVVRAILAEIGNLKPSNKNYRDEKRYFDAILTGKYDPNKYKDNNENFESKKNK
jgi:lysophosphatidylcholine acyltransferase/lyso-PAF acetyltransferase